MYRSIGGPLQEHADRRDRGRRGARIPVCRPPVLQLKKPFIPLRKPGKLPYKTHAFKYELEYGSAELHMHIDALKPGARVLLVDDLLATGGTMRAGIKLIEEVGGVPVSCCFLVELGFLEGREKLKPVEVFSLIRY